MIIYILYVYIVFIILLSFITFFVFYKDKKLSKNNTSIRIKEKTLLSLIIFGGSFGGQIGRIIWRHKTKKIYFSIVIYTSMFFQFGTLIYLIIMSIK